MITVHHLENSRSQRVLWLLEELGLPYQIEHYKRDAKTMLAPASLRKVHALGKSPVVTDGETTVIQPATTRDHTERMLGAHGFDVTRSRGWLRLEPTGAFHPFAMQIPGDPSSAAFLLVAAALRPGAQLTVRSVTLNPGRTGFLDVLESMGASVARTATGLVRGDPIGDVSVSAAPLHGVRLSGPLAVRALDELPLVGLLAAAAAGETVVSGAAALRAKESDRIAATVRLARAVGAAAEERPDGFVVLGSRLRPGGSVHADGDHRIAMAGAVAAVAADGEFSVAGYEAVEASWPGFGEALEGLWS